MNPIAGTRHTLVAWSVAVRHVAEYRRWLVDNMLGVGLAFLVSHWRDIRVAVGVAGVVRHRDLSIGSSRSNGYIFRIRSERQPVLSGKFASFIDTQLSEHRRYM